MKLNKVIDDDISNQFFFLKPEYFFQFYFFFFFKCLYAALFDLTYIFWHGNKLNVNKSLTSNNKDYSIENALFVGDSTISFPSQSYSYPYLLFNDGYVKDVDILARPGVRTRTLLEYIKPILKNKNKKYDLIFISCFLNEIIQTDSKLDEFARSSKHLIQFLRSKLNRSGKVVYVYGDFSLHPIVPNNYFKKYFRYKTKKFISLLEKYEDDNFEFSLLMDFNPNESIELIKSYFYMDGLHFSKDGQIRLFEDLKKSLV